MIDVKWKRQVTQLSCFDYVKPCSSHLLKDPSNRKKYSNQLKEKKKKQELKGYPGSQEASEELSGTRTLCFPILVPSSLSLHISFFSSAVWDPNVTFQLKHPAGFSVTQFQISVI